MLPYDLGKGRSAATADEAMDIFLEREFPEILGVANGGQHQVKFIPDSYIYGNVVEQVNIWTPSSA